MTILGVKNQLITHFLQKDTFEFKKHDLISVQFDKETADFREELTELALADLEQLNIVRKVVNDDRTMWVLIQPIHSFQQQVTVGPLVAEVMANTINFVNEMEHVDLLCDKTKIDEGDILRLVKIVEDFIEDNDEPQAPSTGTGSN